MTSPPVSVRPVRAGLAALLGGAVGAFVIGYATGQVVSLVGSGEAGAWAALGWAILGAAVGAFVGAATALALAFRHEPARPRRLTVLTTLVGGPVLFVVLALVAGQVSQDWNLPPLWLLVSVVVSALAGRGIAARTSNARGSHRRGS